MQDRFEWLGVSQKKLAIRRQQILAKNGISLLVFFYSKFL